jgi:uncharacterized protein
LGKAIDYGNLMHRAMRGLIQEVLAGVQKTGLPGKHHFFITFDTQHPDAELADWLSDRYPGEMTIVLQHWFADLEVGDEGFAVTLNFGDSPEPLFVPYDAIKTFVDPSVEFGLRFETQTPPDSAEPKAPADPQPSSEPVVLAKPARSAAEVVSLDKFRK